MYITYIYTYIYTLYMFIFQLCSLNSIKCMTWGDSIQYKIELDMYSIDPNIRRPWL